MALAFMTLPLEALLDAGVKVVAESVHPNPERVEADAEALREPAPAFDLLLPGLAVVVEDEVARLGRERFEAPLEARVGGLPVVGRLGRR